MRRVRIGRRHFAWGILFLSWVSSSSCCLLHLRLMKSCRAVTSRDLRRKRFTSASAAPISPVALTATSAKIVSKAKPKAVKERSPPFYYSSSFHLHVELGGLGNNGVGIVQMARDICQKQPSLVVC